MIELLFLLSFAVVLIFTGVSLVGMAFAVLAGFVVMALAGMIGVMFKLLPWLILIGVAVWLYRGKKAGCHHRDRYHRR
ncbi:envelope stress response protein PspG [Photobacterium chitinilyticum]|uniref:Envelope stress response protein PspG n=1 Tax=Photobacterium chitinilyticum TaxID=2485123 RepID=A0A444JIW8_9GAMM|nr:envelope stress response protein PspG [Photobacterium chitinilyticum]RWX53014.1 envelope stress response protein PspG [Photobacterium chitinilyticum]